MQTSRNVKMNASGRKGGLEMTKEEIEQYIELDNKIKNRIVQISHVLKGISGTNISKFVPDFRYWNLNYYDKEDFIENSNQDEELHLGLECYDEDNGTCNFNKSLLMLTDEQINEIVEYDRKKKEENIKRAREAEKARQDKLKKEDEEKEYEQYLRLKKKFEKD